MASKMDDILLREQEESAEDFDEHDVEDALRRAGLSDIEAPKEGAGAYKRLVDAAIMYMSEIKKMKRDERTFKPAEDSENYFSKFRKRKFDSGLSGANRRELHNALVAMLIGKERTKVPEDIANKVANFAAYLTGNDEYVDTM